MSENEPSCTNSNEGNPPWIPGLKKKKILLSNAARMLWTQVHGFIIDSDTEDNGTEFGDTPSQSSDEKQQVDKINTPEESRGTSMLSTYCGQNAFDNVAKTIDSVFGLDPLPPQGVQSEPIPSNESPKQVDCKEISAAADPKKSTHQQPSLQPPLRTKQSHEMIENQHRDPSDLLVSSAVAENDFSNSPSSKVPLVNKEKETATQNNFSVMNWRKLIPNHEHEQSAATVTAMPVAEPAQCEVLQSVHKGSGLPPQPVPPPSLSTRSNEGGGGGGSSFLRKSDTPPPVQSVRSDVTGVRSMSCARSESKSSAFSLRHAEGCDESSCCDEDCLMGVIALTENSNENNIDVVSLPSTTPSPLPSRSPSANITQAVSEQSQPSSSFMLSWMMANGPVAFNIAKTASRACDIPDLSIPNIFQPVLNDIIEILKPLPTCCDLSLVSTSEEIKNFNIASNPLNEVLRKSIAETVSLSTTVKSKQVTVQEVAALSRSIGSSLGCITAAAVSSAADFIASVAKKTPFDQIFPSLPPSCGFVVFVHVLQEIRLQQRLGVFYYGSQALSSLCEVQRSAIMQNIDLPAVSDLIKVCWGFYFSSYLLAVGKKKKKKKKSTDTRISGQFLERVNCNG